MTNMEKLIYKLRTVSCIVALTFGVIGCAEEFTEPTPVSGVTIVDVVKASADFNILSAALKKTNLESSFDNVNSGSYTVFAPSDLAFGKLEANVVENLLKPENKVKLTDLLNLHIVEGKVSFKELKDGDKLKSMNGKQLSVKVDNAKVTVDGSTILDRDVASSNGVIHWMDTVLKS